MVAVAIAAAAMTALAGAGSAGLATFGAAARMQTALSLARSHLEIAGAAGPTADQNAAGTDGPFRWRVTVRRLATAGPGPGIVDWARHGTEARAVLLAVTADVSWRDGGSARSVQLRSKRLDFLPPAGAPP